MNYKSETKLNWFYTIKIDLLQAQKMIYICLSQSLLGNQNIFEDKLFYSIAKGVSIDTLEAIKFSDGEGEGCTASPLGTRLYVSCI